jgi:hypothetical protein
MQKPGGIVAGFTLPKGLCSILFAGAAENTTEDRHRPGAPA